MAASGLVCLVLAAGASGAATEPSTCALVDDAGARLACYDAIFRAPRPAVAETSAVATSEQDVADPAQDFGLTAEQLRSRSAAGQPPDRIRTAVSGIEQSANGRPLITLQNGQRWRQLEATDRPMFKTGEQIEIRSASLGSYLAVVPGSGRPAVRVRRVE